MSVAALAAPAGCRPGRVGTIPSVDGAGEWTEARRAVPVDIRLIEGSVSFAGAAFSEPTVLRPFDGRAEIVSFVDAVMTATVHVAEGVDLSRCDFAGAVGLEHLRFARSPFARRGKRFVLDNETGPACRQLRRAATASGLYALADDLHIAELEAARRSPRRRCRPGGPGSSCSVWWAGTGIGRRVRSPRTW